jgi:hypothetical protein
MNRESNEVKKDRIRQESAYVRGVLFERYSLAGDPHDEYDCLVDHVVSALHRGADVAALANLIELEFRDHFGLPVDPKSADAVAKALSEWWGNHAPS